jgi:DegV family protein with EDD domain
VLEASRIAAAGGTVQDVLAGAADIRERVRMIVGVDKLDNLAKGGRIGAVSAFLGGLLNLKVTFTVAKDGTFEPVGRTRGRTAALEHTVDWVKGHMGDATRGAFCVMHAMSPENAEWLRDRLEKTFTATEMHVVEVGVVIATHTGTGWGVAVLPGK